MKTLNHFINVLKSSPSQNYGPYTHVKLIISVQNVAILVWWNGGSFISIMRYKVNLSNYKVLRFEIN